MLAFELLKIKPHRFLVGEIGRPPDIGHGAHAGEGVDGITDLEQRGIAGLVDHIHPKACALAFDAPGIVLVVGHRLFLEGDRVDDGIAISIALDGHAARGFGRKVEVCGAVADPGHANGGMDLQLTYGGTS
jgi:hypothetical protein